MNCRAMHRIALSVVAVATALSGACQPISQTGSVNAPPVWEDATAVLQALQSKKLRLSNDAGSAATQFNAILHWSGGQPDGPTYGCWASRDGDEVTVVILSPSGLPYCYMTNDLLLLMAPAGRLQALKKGSPFLQFERIADLDGFQATAGFLKTPAKQQIIIDLGSILDGITRKALQHEVDASKTRIRLKTDRAQAELVLQPGSALFPLRSMQVKSNSGALAAIDSITVGKETSMRRLTPAILQNASIEVQEIAASELHGEPLVMPASFDTDAGMQSAAHKLSALLGTERTGPMGKADQSR